MSTDNPGARDPYSVDTPGHDCGFNYGAASQLPAGFAPPEGVGERAPCLVVKNNLDSKAVFPPQSQVVGVQTLGVQGARHLGQWIKIPTVLSAAVIAIHNYRYFHALPPGTSNPSPVPLNPPPGEPAETNTGFNIYPSVWFLSKDRKRAGEVPAFRVRSVAFGSIPVQVTVHLNQPQNAEGKVEPITLVQHTITAQNVFSNGAKQIYRDAYGEGSLTVRLSDLLVDGQRVDVGSQCRTAKAGILKLRCEGYGSTGSGVQPTGSYNGQAGGLLTGTVDIPDFVGCNGANGDDLSALLTNAVSGVENPISVKQSNSSSLCYPRQTTSSCGPLSGIDLPDKRPTRVSAPDNLYSR